MTMPTSGDLSLLEAMTEFYSSAGGLGLVDMWAQVGGSSTISPSQRNGLNNAIAVFGSGNPIGLTQLYGSSGANILGFAQNNGSWTGTPTFGRGLLRFNTNLLSIMPFTAPIWDGEFSIPSGETITSFTINSQTTSQGGTGVITVTPGAITTNRIAYTATRVGGPRGTPPWYNYWDFTINSATRSRRFIITCVLDGSPDP